MTMSIETRGLTRTYQTYKKPEGVWNSIKGFWQRSYIEKIALAPTDLRIEGGQIVGLVGANGAGKTTLLKLLSGLIYPSGGEATVLGYSPWARQSEYLRKISILLGQKNQLWWDIPPADSFDLLARIYDVDEAEAKKRVLELSELLRCRELLQVQLRRLSLGERMKMEIIGSLLHRPQVLFLDEPTIGLDIVAQTTIREFLAEYVRRERPTIILTSHYMDDISRLADRLLLISAGRIVYDGTVDDFMEKAEERQTLSLRLTQPPKDDVELTGDVRLRAGTESFSAALPSGEIAPVLQKIMSISPVKDLKVEEADFEDVIRKFLET
jgi:ABC-2 type transport system ATP-binding protein